MNQASLLNYFNNLDNFKNDKEKIYYILKHHFPNGATEEDLQTFLEKPKHCYSGRFTELLQEGRIYTHGMRTMIKDGRKRTMNIYYAL